MDRRRVSPDEEVVPRAWAGLAVVAAALFVATLDAMVLYVAFGTIRRDFPDVSAAALSWILSGYTIVLAAGMIGAGRWADRLGRRRVFLAGMGVFTGASAICAVAPGVGVLVAARVLQGFGAAALTPASIALILRAFPKSRVPQAIALWGAAGALAAALGPTIGGLFVEAWGWRSVFVVNVPIGIAVAIFGRRLLDESREPDGSRLPDPVGTVVVTVALVLLALAIVQSGAWGGRVPGPSERSSAPSCCSARSPDVAPPSRTRCSRSTSSPSAAFAGRTSVSFSTARASRSCFSGTSSSSARSGVIRRSGPGWRWRRGHSSSSCSPLRSGGSRDGSGSVRS